MTETLDPALPRDLEENINRSLKQVCERQLSLVTAESCTGGLLASILTDVEGVAHVFDRGFVVYSNESKRDVLGVSQDLLDGVGPVSEAVARAMAEGALARRGGPTRWRVEHFGAVDRGAGRIACLRTAIEMIRQAVD